MDTMIKSRLRRVRLDKEERDGRKWPYRAITEATGVSKGTLVRLMNSEFDRVEVSTLNALCNFFGCGVGDILEHSPDSQEGQQANA